MCPDLNRLQSVFLEAVNAPTAAGRAAVLDRECAGDDDLRRWVASLLQKHHLPELALDTPVLSALGTQPDDAANPEPIDLPPGTTLAGRYRLLERLGQGGMGAVYRAEQFAPVRRIVAVKLIKLGFDSETMLARFATERQALARMDHPNIAKILDAGVIEPDVPARVTGSWQFSGALGSGRPYFVMELVEGLPITQYCTKENTSLRQRLELVIPVCRAIEHAHQKGIIHRDLKPANVLITLRDGLPVPVVIDFGIAKSLEGRLDDATLSGSGLFLGTLDYMAPEQAADDPAGIDTRADVYALGAMLYELLCGDVPLGRDQLRKASVFEIARILQEVQPAAPSSRLDISSRKAGEVRGELDWIALKCLEKDRDRRYPSARALADDIAHYLANEPITAGPPTTAYRVRKFVGRHLAAVVAASLLALALVGGIAGTTWGMIQARQSEATAVAERDAKERARAAEAVQRTRADAEAANAQAVSQFFQVDVIRQANIEWQQIQSEQALDPNMTVRTALDRAAATIESRFRKQPALEGQIRRSIGYAYDGLGEYETAALHLRQAIVIADKLWGPDHDLAIRPRYELGNILLHSHRLDEAIPLLERALEWRRSHLGATIDATLNVETDLGLSYGMVGRYDEAEQLLTHVYDCMRPSGPTSINTIRAQFNLIVLDMSRRRFNDAIKKTEGLISLATDGHELEPLVRFRLLAQLGQLYVGQRRIDDAIRVQEAAVASGGAVLPPEHPLYINAVFVLANVYWETGRTADAKRVLEQLHEKLLAKLGPRHIRVHETSMELTTIAIGVGDLAQAETLARNILAALANSAPSYATFRANALTLLGRVLLADDRAADAEPLFRDALALYTDRQHHDWRPPEAQVLLGLALAKLKKHEEARVKLTEGYGQLKGRAPQIPFQARQSMHAGLVALIDDALSNKDANAVTHWRAELQGLSAVASAADSTLP